MKREKTVKQLDDKLTPRIITSPLLIVGEVFFVIGAIFALVSLVRLIDPAHRQQIMYGIVAQNIVDPEAITTWFYIVIIGKVLFTLFALTFALGIAITAITAATCKGNPCKVKGLGFISAMNKAAVWVWVALLGISVIVFAFRIVAYTVALLQTVVDFVFPLAAVVVGEAVMVLMIGGITALLIIGWRSLSDLATHLRYMLYTERLDGHIAPVSYITLFVLSAISLYLAGFFSYDVIAVISFASLAVASLLTGIWTRIVKSRVEWMHFLNYEREKNNK